MGPTLCRFPSSKRRWSLSKKEVVACAPDPDFKTSLTLATVADTTTWKLRWAKMVPVSVCEPSNGIASSDLML